MSKTYSAGIVTAYGAAKRAGYHGTYEDFCRQQAQYAENAAAVEAAKTAAQTAANTATTKAGEATTAATAAQTAKTQTEAAASQALTDISTARSGAISAVQTEGQTQTANARAQAQAAAQSATTASTKASEASASATSAGQSATNAAASATNAASSASAAQAVLESIPEEYSDLSEDVDKLKADLVAITRNERIPLESGGYIRLSEATADIINPTASDTYSYAVVPCSENDVFTINASGRVTAKPWGFVSDDGTILVTAIATSSITDTVIENAVIVAPAGTAYLVINNKGAGVSYKGEILADKLSKVTRGLEEDLKALYPVKYALASSLNKNRFDGRTYEGQLTSTGSLVTISSEQWVTTNYIYIGDLANINTSCKNLTTGNRVDLGLYYLCTYDSDCNFIRQVGTISTGKYTVESGVSYIRFSYRSEVYSEIQIESGSTKSAYSAFSYKALTDLMTLNDRAMCACLCESLDNTSFVDITEDFTLSAGYIDKNNGNFVSYSSGETTDFINIFEYTNLYVSGSPLYSSNCLYAVYDKSKVFLGAYKQNTTETDYHISFNEIKGVYPSAQFVRFSSITTGIPLTIKRPSTLAELLVAINQKEWVGKKWVCVGDSLTEQNSRTTKHYFDYVADSTGISVVNMGLSGSGYAKKADTEQAFYQRISAVPTDADVITIFGSGNDMSASLEVGTPSDTGTTTLCGCINTTIDNLYAVYPLAVLGIVTPTPWLNTKPSDTSSNFYLYCQAIKQICANRGIPCLDLFHESGLRPWQESFRQLAYSKDGGNGVHPDETGHKLIAPRFKAFLETLLM